MGRQPEHPKGRPWVVNRNTQKGDHGVKHDGCLKVLPAPLPARGSGAEWKTINYCQHNAFEIGMQHRKTDFGQASACANN
ncbi:hypothetical protein C2S52_023320 [Perilla frutescens var. hirtella]|nr:hypothetical protein C2S52_023320 [Perilla frutescens var. hirtella]